MARRARGSRVDSIIMPFGLRVPAVLLALAGLLLTAPTAIDAIDAKCSACAAVAGQLQTALEAEKPRNHVDLRGRLDSKGVRYGKLIPYDVSEQRFTELMEGVCEGLGRYTLRSVKPSEGPSAGTDVIMMTRDVGSGSEGGVLFAAGGSANPNFRVYEDPGAAVSVRAHACRSPPSVTPPHTASCGSASRRR